jgi:hypothetical protein
MDKEAADKKSEMAASMGKPSTFKTGPTGTAPAPATEAYHPSQKMSMADHLKSILGISGKEIIGGTDNAGAPKTAVEAVSEAVKNAPKTPGYGE